jgi:NADH-quinone oxidoreductase subunit L
MHAFFKAQLFLGSGSVIHGMEHGVLHSGENVDTQDMFNMGGLRKKMPVTFWTFLIGGFALSGFPLITAGFWSKDAILGNAFSGGFWLVFAVLALAALLTAFYTMRQITLTFLGEPRTAAARNAQESRYSMTIPLIVLSVFSIAAGWSGISKAFPVLGGLVPDWFGNFVSSTLQGIATGYETATVIPLLISLVVALGGLYIGWLVYSRLPKDGTDPLQKALGFFHGWLKNKYYVDELYHFIFVVPATWVAETFTVAWIDQGLLDGFIHGIARIVYWLGNAVRSFFDLPVINWTGDMIAKGVRGFGFSIKPVQTGKIQQYLIMTLVVALVVIVAVYMGVR